MSATSTAGSAQGPWQTFEAPAGVIDPLSPGISPQSGGGQVAVAGTGGQTGGSSGRTSTTTSQTPSPFGPSTKAPAPKLTAGHKHKTKHKHHSKKIERHRSQAKKHKP